MLGDLYYSANRTTRVLTEIATLIVVTQIARPRRPMEPPFAVSALKRGPSFDIESARIRVPLILRTQAHTALRLTCIAKSDP